MLRIGGIRVGTGFTVETAGKQFIVTAEHVVEDARGCPIEVMGIGGWSTVYSANSRTRAIADVAAIELVRPITVSKTHPLPLDASGLILGQLVYVCGFPKGLHGGNAEMNFNRPMPLIQGGTLAALVNGRTGRDLMIDTHLYEGTSGAPIVFSPNNKPMAYRVAGIVTSRPTNAAGIAYGTDVKHIRDLLQIPAIA